MNDKLDLAVQYRGEKLEMPRAVVVVGTLHPWRGQRLFLSPSRANACIFPQAHGCPERTPGQAKLDDYGICRIIETGLLCCPLRWRAQISVSTLLAGPYHLLTRLISVSVDL